MGHGAEVIIALGSNMGNRSANLAKALAKMKEMGIQVLRHSCLYETLPVGYSNQDDFLNSAVLATTSDPPNTLLQKLKSIEEELGRKVKDAIRFGPRPIDLDIICYGNQNIQSQELTVPHPRWKERDFVKTPLRDLAGSYATLKTEATEKVDKVLKLVQDRALDDLSEKQTIRQVLPFRSGALGHFGSSTWMMHVLNITPDSFSEAQHLLSDEGTLKKEALLKSAREGVECGVKILDLGGQSTRPGSTHIPPDVELTRILPTIPMLVAQLGPSRPYLSIDTFHAEVAKEAVLAGVDIINDISGGTLDTQMYHTVAELNVPYVIMHMRGTPQTMLEKKCMTYGADPVKEIGQELMHKAQMAMENGIPAWNLILDPGIGFAKSKELSLQILKELGRLKGEILQGTCAKMPLLVGMSRKRFFDLLIGERAAEDRDLATGAMIVDCIRNGVDILRIHNPEISKDSISVADALYRKFG